ncbi:MAG: hypothetical protein JW915_17240 [Chitinispirillaceae bacterium]|nr:hypothetical protein [Chitinispirillaceae bacterium]
MNRGIVLLRACFIVLVFLKCSLFTPRDTFEEPDDQSLVDMQWIGKIMECPQNTLNRGIKFDDYLITEIFAETFEYLDVNVPGGAVYGKTSFVNHLTILGTPKSVEWQDAGTCTYRGSDTIMVRDTKYEIEYDTIKFNGRSDFDIVKQDKYRIIRWINYPMGSGESYFTPLED